MRAASALGVEADVAQAAAARSRGRESRRCDRPPEVLQRKSRWPRRPLVTHDSCRRQALAHTIRRLGG
eukprot:4963184-Prymnesium_polylepis.1